MRKVLVLGASPNSFRYSFQAVHRLVKKGFQVYPVGIRKGLVAGVEIITQPSYVSGIDTITMYLSAERQKPYYDLIFAINPIRIIFNPGAENEELANLASARGIQVANECTLVLLQLDEF